MHLCDLTGFDNIKPMKGGEGKEILRKAGKLWGGWNFFRQANPFMRPIN